MVAPFIGGNLHPIGGKKRPIFSVSLRHPSPTKFWWVIRQDADTDTARTRPVLKLAKRQDNLELSYLCRTFVLLMEWQERKTRTRARQGKKKRCRYDTTTQRVYNLEMHDLQFGIVIPLSYLCIVEIRTKSNQNE